MATNLLRGEYRDAARRAEAARTYLTGAGADVLSRCVAGLSGAWLSPSAERARFDVDLAGAGVAVLGVLDAQGSAWWAKADREPLEVDPADPVHGWKADPDVVGARFRPVTPSPYWDR